LQISVSQISEKARQDIDSRLSAFPCGCWLFHTLCSVGIRWSGGILPALARAKGISTVRPFYGNLTGSAQLPGGASDTVNAFRR
jgi:hypothetical protein